LEAARLLVAGGRDVAVVALVDPPTITARQPARRLWSLLGRTARKQDRPRGGGLAHDVPAPLAVPLLVFSTEYEVNSWRRISADVELIHLPGSPHDWATKRAAAVASYLRARIQSIGESRIESATTQGVR
jgi:oxalate---CoA ligase